MSGSVENDSYKITARAAAFELLPGKYIGTESWTMDELF